MTISATFACRECGSDAGTVRLVDPGAPTPIPESVKGAPPGIETLFQDEYRIVIDEWGSFTVKPDVAAQFRVALRNVNPAEIWAIDLYAAPFWCPDCSASYCRQHWTTDRARSTSDNLCARCPTGHLRRIWGD